MSTDAVGGVWTYADELRAGLGAEGVDVVLATLGPLAPPEPHVLHLPGCLEWQDEPWEDVRRGGRWLLGLAEELRADIVHLNGFAHGALCWPVPSVVVAHSCVPSWHEAVRGAPAPPAWERYRAAVGAGLRGADAVIAPTAMMREALRRHHDLQHRCEVIANGVSPHPGPHLPKEPFVLGAGRLWDEAKGLAALDRAAQRIAWPVEVAGDAGGAGLRHVRTRGVLERRTLRELMGRAAIFAHPARYEPFGLVVLEAALAGCALVLGDIPSLRELWDGAARFVAPGDHAALARALEELAADAPLREQLGARACERAGDYELRAMAASYAALYARLSAARMAVA